MIPCKHTLPLLPVFRLRCLLARVAPLPDFFDANLYLRVLLERVVEDFLEFFERDFWKCKQDEAWMNSK
jgi:hypothetical protein